MTFTPFKFGICEGLVPSIYRYTRRKSTWQAERDSLKRDRDRAKESYKQQLLDNNELEKQFSSTLEAFNNQAKQTARILDSKLLDKILRGVGEESTIEEITPFDPALLHAQTMG